MSGKKAVRPEPKMVTTEYVRKHYAQSPVFFEDRRTVAHWQTPDDIEYAGRQFDAWLAAHDADTGSCVRSLSRRMGTKGITVPSCSWWFGSRRVLPLTLGLVLSHRPLSLPVSGDSGTRVLVVGIVRTTRHLGVSCLAVGLWESGRHSTYNTKE